MRSTRLFFVRVSICGFSVRLYSEERRTPMPQFLILLRDAGTWPGDFSPDEMQAIIQKYGDWVRQIGGKGEKLRDGEGRIVVRKPSGITVTDGPYAESKEILGGYLVVDAESYEDVIRNCEGSPHLDYGSIEIRAIEP
jgi:hypothetical protein